MSVLWPHSNTIARDANDLRVTGAFAYFYDGNTTTPRSTYQEPGLTTLHAWPVAADAAGRFPSVFIAYGSYGERITAPNGTVLWHTPDIPNPDPNPPVDPGDPDVIDENSYLRTGQIVPMFKSGTEPGFVRANGRSISNATGGGTERNNADTQALWIHIYDNLADAQAPVSGGRTGVALTDYTAGKTITLPDYRGSALIGHDGMGAGVASRLTAAPVVSGGPTTAGGIIGANTHTLVLAELTNHTHDVNALGTSVDGAHVHPLAGGVVSGDGSHTHNFSGGSSTLVVSDPGDHTHPVANGANIVQLGASAATIGTGGFQYNAVSLSTTGAGAHTHTLAGHTDTATHTHTLSGSTDSSGGHFHTVSGTATDKGGGGAHNNVARSGVVTYHIKL